MDVVNVTQQDGSDDIVGEFMDDERDYKDDDADFPVLERDDESGDEMPGLMPTVRSLNIVEDEEEGSSAEGAAEPAEVVDHIFDDVRYESYKSEEQLAHVQALIEKDLSEPYSIFTYRYFINN